MDTAKLDHPWKYGDIYKTFSYLNALQKTASFIYFQNVEFYVVEDLPGQGLLQRILQREVV